MAVKVREQAFGLARGFGEVHDEDPAAGLEDPLHLSGAVHARAPAQVMEHQCAQDHVELAGGKRQRLRGRVAERNLDARLASLPAGSCDHLGRWIDGADRAARSDVAFRFDREAARSAADIQHGFAGTQPRGPQGPLTKGALATQREEPYDEVVARRVQRTRASLHEALASLIHEKPYDSISVCDILARANVGKSTFYMHFDDKDDLLVNGIEAATFVFVLNWWLDDGSPISPKEADAMFRALVEPTLGAAGHGRGAPLGCGLQDTKNKRPAG